MADRAANAMSILDAALAKHQPSSLFAMFSGGHDSVVTAHITAQHPAFTAAVHITTGIGIPETSEYVRETCRHYGWPLLELKPPKKSYDEVVREFGFQRGPRGHAHTYNWLKLYAIEALVRDHKLHRNDRIGLATGIRKAESVRRMKSAMVQEHLAVGHFRKGAQLWIAPILEFTALDREKYMVAHGLPENPVVRKLHKSGECLCGALTAKGEMREIAFWYPEFEKRIRALEDEVEKRGLLNCRWGQDRFEVAEGQTSMPWAPLCYGCDAGRGVTP